MTDRPVIAVLHHLERPFLGHAGPALSAAGARLEERFLREGDALPALGEVDGIVSLGGEQSAVDPALEAEAALLREATAARRARAGGVPRRAAARPRARGRGRPAAAAPPGLAAAA